MFAFVLLSNEQFSSSSIWKSITHQYNYYTRVRKLTLSLEDTYNCIILFTKKAFWKNFNSCWFTTYNMGLVVVSGLNTLRPRQNGRHFPDDTFKHIFLNKNVRILIKISLKFVPKGPINKISALVQIMAWCRPGDKPLSEPMMVYLPTHICISRPQWVKKWKHFVQFYVSIKIHGIYKFKGMFFLSYFIISDIDLYNDN